MPEVKPAIEIATLPDADLRRHTRHLCVEGGVLRLAVRPEFRGRRALLVDVSVGGIGFLVEEPLDADTMLAFELRALNVAESITRIARVRHSRPHPIPADAPWLPQPTPFNKLLRGLFRMPTPVGQAWLVGCEFDRPLSEDDIHQLLMQLRAASGFEA